MVDHWRRQATPATRVAMRHSLHFVHLSCSSIRPQGILVRLLFAPLAFWGDSVVGLQSPIRTLGRLPVGSSSFTKIPVPQHPNPDDSVLNA